MSTQLKDYKTKVRSILAEHPTARNNDGSLQAYFIYKYCRHLVTTDIDGKPAIRLENLKNLPPLETIRRSRQIIQNDNGEYLPTDPAVRRERKIKEENYRNAEVRQAKLV